MIGRRRENDGRERLGSGARGPWEPEAQILRSCICGRRQVLLKVHPSLNEQATGASEPPESVARSPLHRWPLSWLSLALDVISRPV